MEKIIFPKRKQKPNGVRKKKEKRLKIGMVLKTGPQVTTCVAEQ